MRDEPPSTVTLTLHSHSSFFTHSSLILARSVSLISGPLLSLFFVSIPSIEISYGFDFSLFVHFFFLSFFSAPFFLLSFLPCVLSSVSTIPGTFSSFHCVVFCYSVWFLSISLYLTLLTLHEPLISLILGVPEFGLGLFFFS